MEVVGISGLHVDSQREEPLDLISQLTSLISFCEISPSGYE